MSLDRVHQKEAVEQFYAMFQPENVASIANQFQRQFITPIQQEQLHLNRQLHQHNHLQQLHFHQQQQLQYQQGIAVNQSLASPALTHPRLASPLNTPDAKAITVSSSKCNRDEATYAPYDQNNPTSKERQSQYGSTNNPVNANRRMGTHGPVAGPEDKRGSMIASIPTHAAVSNSSSTTSTTMPITTVLTTTAVTTSIMSTGVQQSTTMVSSSVMISSKEDSVKRKKPDTEDTSEPNKVHITEESMSGENVVPPCDTKEVLMKVYSEIMGIKTTVNKIEQDNIEWKSKFVQLESVVSEIKDSVEMAHGLIGDEKQSRLSFEKEIKSEMNERKKEMASNSKLIKAATNDMSAIKASGVKLSAKVDNIEKDLNEIKKPMKELTSKVEEKLGPTEFPVDRTLVAQGVWYDDDEDLVGKAEAIIHKALELPEVKIVRTHRKSGQKAQSKKGLIKIELESADALKTVLKAKRKLKDVNVRELRDVYLRQSKKEEVLVMERNMDLVLRDMGVRDDYVRHHTGHLFRVADKPSTNQWQGSN